MAKSEMVKRSDVIAYLRFMAENGPSLDMMDELGVDEKAIRLAQGALAAAAMQLEMGNPCLKRFNLSRKEANDGAK